VITTEAKIKDLYEKGSMEFYVFETESKNQEGQTTVKATWTNIVRAG
jgi:hypothetical protein